MYYLPGIQDSVGHLWIDNTHQTFVERNGREESRWIGCEPGSGLDGGHFLQGTEGAMSNMKPLKVEVSGHFLVQKGFFGLGDQCQTRGEAT